MCNFRTDRPDCACYSLWRPHVVRVTFLTKIYSLRGGHHPIYCNSVFDYSTHSILVHYCTSEDVTCCLDGSRTLLDTPFFDHSLHSNQKNKVSAWHVLWIKTCMVHVDLVVEEWKYKLKFII